MKKSVLILSMIFLGTIGFLNAQVIENFESITMNLFDGGTNGAISVIANPDPTVNESMYVGKMVRGFDGQPWAGWYSTIPTPVDVTANRYVHVWLWKPRISPIVFKYEGPNGNSGDVFPMNEQTLINQWEEFVFDMSVVSGDYDKIVLIPDFENPLTLTEDITLYFDNIYANDDPAVGSDPVQVMEDYEHITLNHLGDDADDSYTELVYNPDVSGANLSPMCIHFNRDMDGLSWAGFWSALPFEIDVTENKYIHVKVWKPRISELRFKLEGGAAGTLEIPSMYPQTKTEEWEDIVFDFSELTGTYSIIAFLPDFEDPLTLTEDIDIYFDDILLNNDPNPIEAPAQTINVDMTESGMTAGEPVWISGALGGIYGTWNEPGTNPNNEMLDPDGDGIYSITLSLPESLVQFKFFWGMGWDNGDPAPGGDRTLQLENTMNVLYKWGEDGIVPSGPAIHWVVNMSYQIDEGNFVEGTDVLDVAGTFNDWPATLAEDYVLTAMGDGLYEITVEGFEVGEMIEYKFRINGDWNTSEFPDGGPNRTYTVEAGMNEITVWYNDESAGIHDQVQSFYNIYPNPVNDKLYIGNMKDVNKVEIYSVSGKLLKSIDYSNAVEQTQINLNELNAGMYILTIHAGGSLSSTKLLKY